MFSALLGWNQAPQWGKKEKQGQIGKISASEASPAVVWGGKSGQTLFSFFPQCEISHFLPFPLSFSLKKMQMGFFSQRGQLHNSTTLNVLNNKLET